jgi:DNA-binding FadR family transcriptional regulator
MAVQDRKAHFDESRQEHRALLLAMRAGDETGAREAMREHLQNGRRRIFGQS